VKRLHVLIPYFNEPGTLGPCLERVFAAELPGGWRTSIMVVDDGSSAEGREAAARAVETLRAAGRDIALIRHEMNRGKGAAVGTALDAVLADDVRDGDLVIIQDADLEYDPNDFAALMQPVLSAEADAVVGTRWGGHREVRGIKRRMHALGNRALTALSNRVTGVQLMDMECCYKLMSVGLARRVRPLLSEPRFGIEPQLIAAWAALGASMSQVPVHYEPRGTAAGKKIGWRDAVWAVIVIVRERGRLRKIAR
jgi:glycosyltransferase involved in cell wall biosynthesis